MPAEESTRREVQLLERVAAGDRAAFAQLYDLYARPLHAFALRMLGTPAEAEDVLQEVFVQIWERAGQYREEQGKPFSWCVAMTRNKAIDRLRSQQRRHRLTEAAVEAGAVVTETAVEGKFNGDEATKIRAAVEILPAEQRRAIEMAFFGGMTHHEIADTLQEPLGTVKARIRRGMLSLRATLEGIV